jgi:hypothetical protein
MIFNLGAMPQKQNYFEVHAAQATKKLLFLNFFGLEFFS